MIDKQKFNKIRKNKNITLQQLSKITGLTYSTLSKISAGYVDTPRDETLKAISDALDVPVSALLTEDEWDISDTLTFLPLNVVKLLSKYFVSNPSSEQLINALFGSTDEEKAVSIETVNLLIPAYEALLNTDEKEKIIIALTILSNKPQLIDIVLHCENKSEEYIDKLSSFQNLIDD